MPKADFMSPKAIANRIKAKGLQKLRWYCQMCNKQCRDENGFKCHTMTEGHIRMMAIFAESADKHMSDFSNKFERGYLAHLSRRYGEKRVLANSVYNEYIQDKEHVHMNSTMWTTLTDFVKFLGRTGKCVIDETERGWFIQYINRDPEVMKRQEAAAARKALEMDDEMRHEAELEAMVAAAHTLEETMATDEHHEVKKFTRAEGEDGKVKIQFTHLKGRGAGVAGIFEDGDDEATSANKKIIAPTMARIGTDDTAAYAGQKRSRSALTGAESRSALDSIINEEQSKKRLAISSDTATSTETTVIKPSRKENWITPGIIVKIMNAKLGDGRFFKRKGEVVEVQDLFIAIVEMLDTREMIKIDQSDLETVIPAIGHTVRVLQGPYRFEAAELIELDIDKFSASVRLLTGRDAGLVVKGLEYEDICKRVEKPSASSA